MTSPRATHDEPTTAASAPTDRQLDLLDLLTEIRALVAADTAVLLLLDGSGKLLVPVTAVGIDRAGRAGMRIRRGEGFAGTIAATGRPVVLDTVTPDNVVNHQLLSDGLRSLAGVPVLLRGTVIGVLHVGSRTPRSFTERDVQLLQGAASRLAVAVRDRRTTEEHTAALVLQRSLLPNVLPEVGGLELAARYIPADGDFGGDWYDVFRLPGNRIGIVMGDVIGHGLRAAVVMGRLRSALRAYALEHDDPAVVLSHLDRKISHFEPDAFATVFYAVGAAPYDEFRVSSAGHPAPLFAAPGETARQLDVPADPPLAVAPDRPRRTTTVSLGHEATMCLFTDGLVERRPDGTDKHQHQEGVERALRCLDAYAEATSRSAEAISAAVIEATLGNESNEDDTALLVIRRSG